MLKKCPKVFFARKKNKDEPMTKRFQSARQLDPHLRELETNLDWVAIGKRLRDYRQAKGLSPEETAERVGIPVEILTRLESGKPRKSANYLWQICETLQVSKLWFFKGQGDFSDADPKELLPVTLVHDRGAGIRRRQERVDADEGSFTDEPLEFVMAVDAYRKFNNVTFVSWTEAFEILLALGYRRVATPTIDPKKGNLLKKEV